MITAEDVKDSFETGASDKAIELAIGLVASAEQCLLAYKVPQATIDALLTYAVRHILTIQENGGRGLVKSESAPSGASRSYVAGQSGQTYLDLVNQLDRWGCVTGLLGTQQGVAAWSV